MATHVDFLPHRLARTNLIVALAIVCAAWTAAGRADETPPAASSANIRTLVRQLNHAELAQRDAAERQLVALGTAALTQLPEITPGMSAEIQHRLTRIRNRIEQAEAEAAVQPTRVTLEGGSLELAAVLKQIQEQTGNELFDYRSEFGQPATERQVALKLNNEPFWPAVDQLLDQASLTIYPYAERARLGLIQRPDRAPQRVGSAAYSGPFRLEPVNIRTKRDLRDPAGALLHVGLEVAWEPRLRPVMLKRSADKFTALGDDEEPIASAQDSSQLEIPIAPGATAVELEIPLELPPRSMTKITRLHGELEAIVPGKMVAFEFDDLLAAEIKPQRQAGAVVTIDSVRKNNDLWEVRVRLKFDNSSGALASHHGWVYDNRCFLRGPGEAESDNAAFERYAESENEVGVGYLFDVASLKGQTLVYVTPAAINRMKIEFELEDLLLP